MILVENERVMNMDNAFRGLRNPMNSWDKSDSDFNSEEPIIGKEDLNLAQRMIKAGNSDSKFMRQILVSMDITAPLYWWKECDQYKVGTVTNSCSTMHKLASRPICLSDFSFDGQIEVPEERYVTDIITILDICEYNRLQYIKTGDKGYWRRLIQVLPESYNQKRTWTANYQVLRAIYFDRRTHKLQEWRDFCKYIENMPYAEELICYDSKQEETHE